MPPESDNLEPREITSETRPPESAVHDVDILASLPRAGPKVLATLLSEVSGFCFLFIEDLSPRDQGNRLQWERMRSVGEGRSLSFAGEQVKSGSLLSPGLANGEGKMKEDSPNTKDKRPCRRRGPHLLVTDTEYAAVRRMAAYRGRSLCSYICERAPRPFPRVQLLGGGAEPRRNRGKVQCTPEERARIKEPAKAAGLTQAAFVRGVVLNRPIGKKSHWKMIDQLERIEKNLHQLLRLRGWIWSYAGGQQINLLIRDIDHRVRELTSGKKRKDLDQ